MEEKKSRMAATPQQWDAARRAQTVFGLPDGMAAQMLGCAYSTVFERRKRVGWNIRKLPPGFRSGGDAAGDDGQGADAPQPAEGPQALAKIMGTISAEVARAGQEGIDADALKRIDTLTAAAKTYERLMDIQARHAPPDAAPTPLEETQAVLAEMDRRVDELAERRARYFIGQWCEHGGCLERGSASGAAGGADG